MCFYSLMLFNSIFCCKLCFFLTFSHICQIYVAEVLIVHFSRYCHPSVISPYEHKSEVNFQGLNSISGSISRSILFFFTFWGSTPSLLPVQYMSHLRWWGRGSPPFLDPSPVLFILILFALSLHKLYIFTFQVQFW